MLKFFISLIGVLSWQILLFINILTFIGFGVDKALSKFGFFYKCCGRISESALLTLVLLGGTPGGYLGMWIFNHKTRKKTFQFQFNLIAFLQLFFFAAFLYYRLEESATVV